MAKKEKVPGMLPGLEETQDPVLSKQCARLLEAQEAKHVAAGAYTDCHDKLMELMQARKVKAYRASGKVFQIESTSKVKHKNLKEKESHGVNPGSDDDEGDEGDEEDLDITGQSDDDEDDVRPQRLKNKEATDKAKTIPGKAKELPAQPTSKLAGYKRTVPT